MTLREPGHGSDAALRRATPVDRELRARVFAAAARLASERALDPAIAARLLGVEPDRAPAPCGDGPRRPDELGPWFERLVAARPAAERKRGGVFYTPIDLAAALTERTLAPLLASAHDDPTRLLALRVVDPAAGGGAFVLPALRRIASAVDDALRRAGWIDDHGRCRAAAPAWFARGFGAPGPEPAAIAARVRALVARRCVFGVDVDRDAVAVLRVAVWLEVADPLLRARHLERNLRHGDALLGADPSDTVRYPIDAFARDAGDRRHPGVHHAAGERAHALAAFRSRHRRAALAAPARLSPDLWCSLWFWPVDRIALAPPPCADPSPEARAVVDELRSRHAFFHWRHEFPRVFAGGGFAAVLGNPPWDVLRPDSRDFFGRHDRDFRSRSKREARSAQVTLFRRDAAIERAWLDELADHAARRHFFARRGVAQPASAAGASDREPTRRGRSDPNSYHLFVARGLTLLRPGGRLGMLVPSGIYTDHGTAPLRRVLLAEHGWLELIGFENRARVFPDVDARFKFCAIVVRRGGTTTGLRARFMTHDVAAMSGGPALELDAATIARLSPRSASVLECGDGADLELARRLHATGARFGDDGGWAIRVEREFDMTLDSRHFRDRHELERNGWVADHYSRWLLAERGAVGSPRDAADPAWIPLRDGRALRADSVRAIALPLIEGRTIGAFEFAQKAWLGGRGRRARWEPTAGGALGPQYLLDAQHCPAIADGAPRLGLMAVGSATNERSMIAAALLDDPCGNSVLAVRCRPGAELALLAVLNSFAYDFALRLRLGGNNLNRFLLDETPLPDVDRLVAVRGFVEHAAALSWSHERFAQRWLGLDLDRSVPWRAHWASTPHDRLRRRCILDAVVAGAFDLTSDDFARILRDCAHAPDELARRRRALDAKGFWRVDAAREPAARHTVLALAAFDELGALRARHGGDFAAAATELCTRDGTGWLLPPDAADRLGPRVTHGDATARDTWAECRAHAQRLDALRAPCPAAGATTGRGLAARV